MKGKIKTYFTSDRLVTMAIMFVIAIIIAIMYTLICGLSNDTPTATIPEQVETERTVIEQAIVYSDSGKKLKTYTNVSNVTENSNYVEFDYTTENYVVKHAKIYNSIIIME